MAQILRDMSLSDFSFPLIPQYNNFIYELKCDKNSSYFKRSITMLNICLSLSFIWKSSRAYMCSTTSLFSICMLKSFFRFVQVSFYDICFYIVFCWLVCPLGHRKTIFGRNPSPSPFQDISHIIWAQYHWFHLLYSFSFFFSFFFIFVSWLIVFGLL